MRTARALVEGGFPGGVWVLGEVRQFKVHSSGHWYFVLRDEAAQVNCVMWRSDNATLGWTPQDGIEVEAFAQPTIFEKQGRFQLMVRRMLPAGKGARAIAFEMLKKKLAAEGLFDKAHKKALPPFPMTIGVVTSITGAAIRDILNILRRRAPWVTVIVRNTLVQGEDAPADIVRAIEEFNRFGEVDLLIVGRGGGSEEDLWCFNDEAVARAIFASRIPIISAVGHEIDISISDFVADLRAPTPSAAAELAVPDRAELLRRIGMLLRRAATNIVALTTKYRAALQSAAQRLEFASPKHRIDELRQRLDAALESAQKAIRLLFERRRTKLSHLAEKLSLLSVERILARGFSIVRHRGTVVRSAEQLSEGDEIDIQFYRGGACAKVATIKPSEAS